MPYPRRKAEVKNAIPTLIFVLAWNAGWLAALNGFTIPPWRFGLAVALTWFGAFGMVMHREAVQREAFVKMIVAWGLQKKDWDKT